MGSCLYHRGSLSPYHHHPQRYDFLSAGMGAMVVTTFCFSRGQDVGTALWISAAATVGAVVLNELLFSDDE